MSIACALHTWTVHAAVAGISWNHLEKPSQAQESNESAAPTGLVWRVSITHYPLSVSHCGHYWQAMDLELELNLTGASVITRIGHTKNRNTHSPLALCVRVFVCKREDCPVSVLISAGRSAAHTMPLIPAPVHLSCRCFLSVWAKTFYLNLLRVPLKGLCYCSEPSCVCVTWESSAA